MPEPLLVRHVMRIGVPTCKLEDTLARIAALMLEGGHTAVVVLDEEADTRGWISEQMLARAYVRAAARHEDPSAWLAQDVMDEHVPECPADIPLAAAAQLMADGGFDHLFFLHHAGGRAWPSAVLSWRDLVAVLAGPEYVRGQGATAARPTPMDLFRQRHGLAGKK